MAGPSALGLLLSGYINLVTVTSDRLPVIDFKTDAPPEGPVQAAYPEYVAQVRADGRLLAVADIASSREIRCGLLFTGDGPVRWLSDADPAPSR